jgi:hypothetical protein
MEFQPARYSTVILAARITLPHFSVPDPPHGWATYPGLRFPGHTAGSRGRGRIQLAVKRAFAAAGTSTLTTSDVFDYALVRVRGEGWRRRHRWSVVRVLRAMCDPIGRDPRHGAIIWRLKASVAESHPRCLSEIIGELATWPILPILQPMLGGRKGEWQPARRGNDCVRLAPGT